MGGTINKMENAIRVAIEGGWKHQGMEVFQVSFLAGDPTSCQLSVKSNSSFQAYTIKRSYSEIREDKFFWQALGKQQGWGIQIGDYKGDVHVNHQHNNGKCTELCVVPSRQVWHRFIDALGEGKSPDDFFNSLLE